MPSSHPEFRSGFTLLEAMIAVTILSLAIFGITAPFAIAAAGQVEDARRTLANALAQEMMEEVLSKVHDDADGLATTTEPEDGKKQRADFDLRDYAVLDEPAGRVESHAGHVVRDAAATGLSRHTRVHDVFVGGQTSPQTAFVRVDVEMRYRGQRIVTLSRLVFCQPRGE